MKVSVSSAKKGAHAGHYGFTLLPFSLRQDWRPGGVPFQCPFPSSRGLTVVRSGSVADWGIFLLTFSWKYINREVFIKGKIVALDPY